MKLPTEPLPIRAIEYVGEWFMRLALAVGQLVMLLLRMVVQLPRLLKHPHLLTEQCNVVGVGSLPLVIFASMFTGAVAAVQAGYQIQDYAPLSLVGSAVGKGVILELGPVLTALVVAGRVSTSIAAELGTMRVTEQMDALETMAIDPVWYLAAPRFFAGLIMMPILVVVGTAVAIVGGYVVSSIVLDLSAPTYFNGVQQYFELYDVFINQLKGLIFGALVTLSGVFFGYRTRGGAVGVGEATISAIVTASVLILVFDFLVAVTLL